MWLGLAAIALIGARLSMWRRRRVLNRTQHPVDAPAEVPVPTGTTKPTSSVPAP